MYISTLVTRWALSCEHIVSRRYILVHACTLTAKSAGRRQKILLTASLPSFRHHHSIYSHVSRVWQTSVQRCPSTSTYCLGKATLKIPSICLNGSLTSTCDSPLPYRHGHTTATSLHDVFFTLDSSSLNSDCPEDRLSTIAFQRQRACLRKARPTFCNQQSACHEAFFSTTNLRFIQKYCCHVVEEGSIVTRPQHRERMILDARHRCCVRQLDVCSQHRPKRLANALCITHVEERVMFPPSFVPPDATKSSVSTVHQCARALR